MGADHTCGNVLPSPTQPHYNPLAPSEQAEPSKQLQVYFAAIDSLGLCLFPSLAILDIPALKQHLIDSASAVLGEPLDERFIENLGEAVLQTERSFNLEAGFTRKDDRLPEFFTYERLPEIGTVFDVSEKELDSVHP
jgi:aldehyde:ferredoxin oxidoreductase